jgi:hypothetical protein
MEKKSEDFSMEEAKRLAKNPAAQQLFAMLQKTNGDQLQKIVDTAQAGNMSQAGQMLQSLLSSPEGQKLLRELGR